jgi:glycosyltransferase involved in cell wall biosynthesis
MKHWPNKLFNGSLFFLGIPKLDRLLGNVDLFFLPNLNFCAFSRRCKTVVTVHDLSFLYPEFYSLKGRLWHWSVRPKAILKKAKAIIAVSESTKRDLLARYDINEEKIHVIPHGIDIEKYRNVSADACAKVLSRYKIRKPYVLFLGNVESRKNVAGLIKAWQEYKKRDKLNCELVLAGQNINSTLNLDTPSVRVINYVDESDKPPLYSQAQAFAYVSYYEGFGLPILEAMAAGVPVLTSFATSLPGLAGPGALIVDPYNYQEIAEGLHQILNNVALRQDFIDRGRQIVRDFSWAKSARATLDIFSNL